MFAGHVGEQDEIGVAADPGHQRGSLCQRLAAEAHAVAGNGANLAAALGTGGGEAAAGGEAVVVEQQRGVAMTPAPLREAGDRRDGERAHQRGSAGGADHFATSCG